MKKVVITGPTGAIGLALIRRCIEADIRVCAVCRPGSARKEELPASDLVHVSECDLSDLKSLPALAGERDFDTFFHLGWAGTSKDAREDLIGQEKNIAYTLDAAKAAEQMGCRRFIGAGSQAEYGGKNEKLTAETPAFPESGYGMAKLCAGQMSRALAGQLGLEHIWARFLSVYGPGDGKNTMVMSVIRQLQSHEPALLSKGEQMWDYLYAEDAAEALFLLGERGKAGKVYPIGSGTARPLRDYAEQIRDAVYPEGELRFGTVEYAPRQVMYLCADITELTKDTGFEPATSFETGIRKTAEWCRTHQNGRAG